MDDVAAKVAYEPPCLYPDEILSGYKLLEPTEYVTIRGQVTRLHPFEDKFVYGDLKGRDCTICFRCPPDQCPTEMYQNVILGGYLAVKPSTIHKGLDVELRGEVVGRWDGPPKSKTELIIPERINPVRTSLQEFIRGIENSHDLLNSFLVVGTQRALDDFLGAAGKDVTNVAVNVSDVRKFIADTQKALSKYQPKAIAVVRGGSDTSRSMDIWNSARLIDWLLKTECLIYSAIGHSDGYVFLDQYADQAFIAPSDMGHSLKEAIAIHNRDLSVSQKYRQIEQENAELSQKIDDLKDDHGLALTAMKTTHEEVLDAQKRQLEEIRQAHHASMEKQRSRTRLFIWATSVLSLGIIGFTSVVLFKEQIVSLLSK